MNLLPPSLHSSTIQTCKKLHPDTVYQGLVMWLQNPVQNVFLHGPPGVGKTCAAAALYRKFYEFNDGESEFISAIRLDSELLEAIKSDQGDGWILNKYRKLQLLILDDFGRENASERVKRQLFDIIDYRQSWRKPTILTSNLSLKQIEERYDPALCSRMNEWIFIQFSGKDLRQGGCPIF